jgi:hypothetical protein
MPLFFVMLADATVARFAATTRGERVRLATATAVCIVAADVLAFSVWPVGSPVKRLLLLQPPPQTAQDRNAVRAGLMLRDMTAPDAVIAVSWAGAIPYFAERPAIDLLGKMDPRIAHQPMHVPTGDAAWAAFVPGHLKWDYAYSIAALKPDVVQAPLWTVPGVSDKPPNLDADYSVQRLVGDWYVRRDSTKRSRGF